uniref:OCIA domain-containing protein 1 n=1 Tax=Jaculus jaculus TaxID=51337 RepID=A0A8C5JXN4_JACJA
MNGRADFRESNAEVPTNFPHREEERRVFICAIGLIGKGILSSHPKYGSIPKLIFACIMGYFAGKLSYVKACQEKFKNLENSPLGEALRSGQALQSLPPGQYSQKSRYNSNVNARAEPIIFSASMNESTPTGITDHVAQGPDPYFEASPKRKSITYEELRNTNRESYEVTLTQKTEPSVRPMQERVLKKEVKVNKYGDTWDE